MPYSNSAVEQEFVFILSVSGNYVLFQEMMIVEIRESKGLIRDAKNIYAGR